MAPPLFTQRSPFGFAAMWYWMHAENCKAGAYRALAVDRQPWPSEIVWVTRPAPADDHP